MVKMSAPFLLFLKFLLFSLVGGSTHWVVTEEGKVQEKLESPFAINQPHDLMAFMKQETTYEKMLKVKEVLVVEKKMIEDNEDKEFNLEEKHYSNDADCAAAGKQLVEFNLYASTVLPLENKDIEAVDYIDLEESGHGQEEPDCGDIQELPPGSLPYDTMEGVANKEYLALYQAEPVLKSTLKYMENEKAFAQAVTTALKQNSSSWVAYNMASLYWRVKGDAEKAIECARRAIFHSPARYRDIALVGLANILHRSHFTINASVVLEDALEVSDASVIHFALGCVYASLGEYAPAAEHFEKCLADQPGFKAAQDRLHAVRCQNKLQEKLEAQHESLQRTLKELESYQRKHKKYAEYYQSIERMQLAQKEQIELHFVLMRHSIDEGTFNKKTCKLRTDEDGGPVLFCNLPNVEDTEEDDELIPNIVSGKNKMKLMEGATDTILDQAAKFSPGGASSDQKKPEDMAINDWMDSTWPSAEFCETHSPQALAWDEYPSSYIDPETRGFPVRDQLTLYLGIKNGESVSPPWNELNCEYLEPLYEKTIIDSIPGIDDRHGGPIYKPDEFMNRDMLMHLNDGVIWPRDVGHRLQQAITKSLAEKDKARNLWLLYNFAGLYFRVMGDNLKAIECIRRGLPRTPAEHLDVPLVNVGNILYRLGRIDDAKKVFVDALHINRSEPSTYLGLGNVFQAKGNVSGAVTFYEYGLFLQPESKEILYALFHVKCGAKYEKETREAILGKDYERKREPTEVESQVFTMESFHMTVTGTEGENSSDQSDLVRRLETTKEDADKILNDADAVIKKLSHVAQDGSKEQLSSSAKKMMVQLSQMRDNLGSLMEEASYTLGTGTVIKPSPMKESFTKSECSQVLQEVDIKSYITSNLNVNIRGYNFTEELPFAKSGGYEIYEPFCRCTSAPLVDDLKTIVDRDLYLSYDGEFGMKTLLEQLIKGGDISEMTDRLKEGMKRNPNSWRLSYLTSYYWRLKGKAKEAINCLRLSLTLAPAEMRDIVFLGLANIFAQLEQWNDALFVAREALLLRPDDFLYHFTLANILAAKGDMKESIPSFKRALELQPELGIAELRYKAAVCEKQRWEA